jgi:hypothetical protein
VTLTISRILVLDYYDGPRQGVFSDLDGIEYAFRWIFEDLETGAQTFCLGELGGLKIIEEIERILAPYTRSDRPVWVPIWNFPAQEDQVACEQEIDKLVDLAASRYTLQFSTPNLTIGSVEVLPVSKRQAKLVDRILAEQRPVSSDEWTLAGGNRDNLP